VIQKRPFALVLAILAWSLTLNAQTFDEKTDTFNNWRCASNGGINALYCYLSVNGVSCKYADLLREQKKEVKNRQHTALTLVHLAAKYGLPLQTVSITENELSLCTFPVIVHMDGESPEAGAFLLILTMSDKAVDYVNGPSATIHEMTRENFRRVWSGIALLPVTRRWEYLIFCLIGFVVGLVLSLVVRFAKSKRYL
jgi:ABC-type bacteriocin/lantibiotic exporter with double-glycine peptidase domain